MSTKPASKPNEVILLQSRLAHFHAATRPDLSLQDAFLVNSVDTILRSAGLSNSQVEGGIVDGSDDGGIDAVYIFLDGQLVEEVPDPYHGDRPRIDLEIIQAKLESGFKETAVQVLLDSVPLLTSLDPPGHLSAEYNAQVLEKFSTFRLAFLKLAAKFPELAINVHYATKAAGEANPKVQAKVARLADFLKQSYPDAGVNVNLVGAAELNLLARERPSSSLALKITEGPLTSEKGGLVGLVTLTDYFDFITDERGRLRDEIFEENVRDYEGDTVINRGIASSLQEGDNAVPDFWWLNNGVTVIGRKARPSGKRFDIEDPQIVNGLQTSRNIYRYFHGKAAVDDTVDVRRLLVRIIETADDSVAGQIIKATNSQNRVEAASLRSAEPFQRDIEEYFKRNGLYYERKKNHYKNLEKPRDKIVEVLELAQAVGAIMRFQPHTARGAPSKFVRGRLYEQVFNSATPLKAYFNCVLVMRAVDAYLERAPHIAGRNERSNMRYHLARASVALLLRSSRPRPRAVESMDVTQLTDDFLSRVEKWAVGLRDKAAESVSNNETNFLAKTPEWSEIIDKGLSRYSAKQSWPKKLDPDGIIRRVRA